MKGVNKLQVPKPNTTCFDKNSVKYLAAITWNKISDTLRSLTLSAFKKAVWGGGGGGGLLAYSSLDSQSGDPDSSPPLTNSWRCFSADPVFDF